MHTFQEALKRSGHTAPPEDARACDGELINQFIASPSIPQKLGGLEASSDFSLWGAFS